MTREKTKKTVRGSVQGLRTGKLAKTKTKLGVMCIVFAEPVAGGERQFLLLHRVLNWSGWEFVKGGIDKGETAAEAGKREIKEEAGLGKAEFVKALEGKHEWDAKGVHYDYSVLIFRADADEKVRLQIKPVKEHDKFGWVHPKDAMAMLKYENARIVFAKALEKM
ncbi:MAG: NUDIX domain-containing protein [Candidatus Diapherotrites archaeon]